MPDDQQTTDDQSTTQTAEADQQTSQDQATTDTTSQTTDVAQQTSDDQSQSQQDTGDQSTGTVDWRPRARRGLTLLQSDTSPEASRTTCMLNHILDDSHGDSYIGDYFNVQQTAGGLPPNVTMEKFIAGVSTHIRGSLAATGATSSFGEQVSDSDFKAAVLGFDVNIRKIITFLNGVVHQIAPGEVHLALWKFILDARSDPNSLYKCYKDYLVDA
jgi:hypothetical protein